MFFSSLDLEPFFNFYGSIKLRITELSIDSERRYLHTTRPLLAVHSGQSTVYPILYDGFANYSPAQCLQDKHRLYVMFSLLSSYSYNSF